jgi:hypothetical protein
LDSRTNGLFNRVTLTGTGIAYGRNRTKRSLSLDSMGLTRLNSLVPLVIIHDGYPRLAGAISEASAIEYSP